jgi:NitT/TauT family transport system substrate-binding protein
MRAAIETGAVIAGMLTTPDVQAAMGEPGKFKLVQDYRALQYPALGLLVVEKWSKANEASARALARAVVKAEGMVRTNRAAVDAALVEMYPALAPNLRAVLAEEAPKLLATDGRMAPAGYALMQRMLKVTDPAMVAVPYEQIWAPALLPQP